MLSEYRFYCIDLSHSNVTFIMSEYLENLKSYTMATVHIATIAIVLERFSECVVALHLMISFNKFIKPIKKRILLVRDPRTYSQVFDCRNYQSNTEPFATLFDFDPSKVDQHIIQSNNQFVMELMDHHLNSLELIQWKKTMAFGVFHMCLSVERIVVTYILTSFDP